MSLKRHFLKNLSTDFSEILVSDVKLVLGKVLKVSRLYLPPFFELSRKSGREGNICPLAGRGLRNAKGEISENDVVTFSYFLSFYAKKKCIALKFCIVIVGT